MHTIDIKNYEIHTDLLLDNPIKARKVYEEDGVILYKNKQQKEEYSTIHFIDVTDKKQRQIIEKILIKELKSYLAPFQNILIIGLGNRNSTPDALGPRVIDGILVTRHLFSFAEVEKGYKSVATFEPKVFGKCGISSVELIKQVVSYLKPDACIILDSLCTSTIDRVNQTIQITNRGIHPGSGIQNDQGELSQATLNCFVLAIGVPTVIDLSSLILDVVKQTNLSTFQVEENLIVTPKDIDQKMEQLAIIISTSINKSLHKAFLSTE